METTVIQSPPRTLMEVFKSLPEGTLVQLIENKLVMAPAARHAVSPSPVYKHQRISNDINVKLSNIVNQNQLGEVLDAPMDVYLDEKNAFQPDIIFISSNNRGIIDEDGFIHGAPDLVIELLSPSTAKLDLKDKKIVYERSGVKEYWIIDPRNKEVKGCFLEEGAYGQPWTGTGRIRSRLLDQEFTF